MRNSARWRQAVVWLHILTSVGWMGQALTLCTLMVIGSTTVDVGVRAGAMSMAHVLDVRLLAPMANTSALTGFLLAAATPWGFFRHWWVLTKFVITVVQLNVGIFLLSPVLRAAVEAAPADVRVSWQQIAGSALMAGAIAYQAWLSVAKPWRRTPWAPRGKPPSAPAWAFALAASASFVDIAVGAALGIPLPLLSVVVLVALLISRPGRFRRALP